MWRIGVWVRRGIIGASLRKYCVGARGSWARARVVLVRRTLLLRTFLTSILFVVCNILPDTSTARSLSCAPLRCSRPYRIL